MHFLVYLLFAIIFVQLAEEIVSPPPGSVASVQPAAAVLASQAEAIVRTVCSLTNMAAAD